MTQNIIPNVGTDEQSQFKQNLAIQALNRTAANAREVLTANKILYVATTGADTNNGTSGSPFLTIQKAINTFLTIDLNGYTGTISVGAGTYTGGVTLSSPFVGGNVTLTGDTSTPSNVIISTTDADCIKVTDGGGITVTGFRLKTAGPVTGSNTAHCLHAVRGGSRIKYGVIDFNASVQNFIMAEIGGQTEAIGGAVTITGNCTNFVAQAYAGGVIYNAVTVTLSGTPTFSIFVLCHTGGAVYWPSATSGSGTGTRFVLNGGTIDVNGAGEAFFPGTGGSKIQGFYL